MGYKWWCAHHASYITTHHTSHITTHRITSHHIKSLYIYIYHHTSYHITSHRLLVMIVWVNISAGIVYPHHITHHTSHAFYITITLHRIVCWHNWVIGCRKVLIHITYRTSHIIQHVIWRQCEEIDISSDINWNRCAHHITHHTSYHIAHRTGNVLERWTFEIETDDEVTRITHISHHITHYTSCITSHVTHITHTGDEWWCCSGKEWEGD